jgi:hypothetical protein
MPTRESSADASRRNTDDHRTRRHVVDHDGVRPDARVLADGHRPDDLRAGANPCIATNDRPLVDAFTKSNRDERTDFGAGVDLHKAVDDHLSVRESDAGTHDHWVSYGNLAPRHRSSMGNAGDHRYASPQTCGFEPVQHEGAEGVSDEDEAHQLEENTGLRGVGLALTALLQLECEVREHRLFETRMLPMDYGDRAVSRSNVQSPHRRAL